MANEGVESQVTPEVTKSSTIGMKGHSDGKASSGNSDEKNVPHYLRASTGSCHDFCKYGKNHGFELKERRSIPNRATRKQLYNSSEDSIGRTIALVSRLRTSVDAKPMKVSMVDAEPMKVSMVKLRESVDSKTRMSDTSVTYNKQDLSTKSFENQKEIGNEVLVNRKKSSLVKVKPSLLLKTHKSPSTRQETSNKEIQSPSKPSSKKVGSPSKSISRKVEAPSKSILNKVEAPSKSTSNKVQNPSKSTSKVKTSSKSTSNMVETSSQLSFLKGKETKSSEKSVTTLNSSSVTRKQVSSTNSSEGFAGQKNSKIKMEKGASSSKAASRKLMAPLTALSSPRPSLKRVASINSRNPKSLKIVSQLRNQQIGKKVELEENKNNEVEEKTLYIVKMESENKTLQSVPDGSYDDDESRLPRLSSPKSSVSSISQSLSKEDQEESDYTTSEFDHDSFSGNNEIEHVENEETLEVDKKVKNNHVVCSEDEDSQMIKLKFRRGKVIDNQIEISSPRRLKFRRVRVLAEKANVKGDAQRKSFKRRDGAGADSNGATTGPEKVVLRHQDMQDKKDAQGLFNNVIEETASKLVETRKSKVKALVGAFETVISLQEKKPSANTVSFDGV